MGELPLQPLPCCGARAASCLCILPIGHMGAHACEPVCEGTWYGDDRDPDQEFTVVTLPNPAARGLKRDPLAGYENPFVDLFRSSGLLWCPQGEAES